MSEKRTTVEINGSICGHLWMPQVPAGYPAKSFDIERESARFTSPPESLRDVALHILTERGGDFQDAAFSEDTLVIVTHNWKSGPVRKSHSRHVRLADWANCQDLVHEGTDSSDFSGEPE